jgi:hypothetical protein
VLQAIAVLQHYGLQTNGTLQERRTRLQNYLRQIV